MSAKNLVETQLDSILKKLNLSKPVDIVIVGSWRWGTQRRESDVDLLVLTNSKTSKSSSTIRVEGKMFDVTLENIETFSRNLLEMKPFEVFCAVEQPIDLRFKSTSQFRELRERFKVDKKLLAQNVLDTVRKDRMRMKKSSNNGVQYCKTLLASCRILDVTCQLLKGGNVVSFRSFHKNKSLPSQISHHDNEIIHHYLRCIDQMCLELEKHAPECAIDKKYPSTPHFPFSPCALGKDDVMSNCVSNFVGNKIEVVVLEKLDGANCCIYNGDVFARTHNKTTSLPWFGTIKSMVRSFDTRVMNMLHEKNLALFGENMTAVHSISYGGLRSYIIYFFFAYLHIHEHYTCTGTFTYSVF